jgi:hypothetical protein
VQVSQRWAREVLEAVRIADEQHVAVPARRHVEPEIGFIEPPRGANVVDDKGKVAKVGQTRQNRRHWRPSRSMKASAHGGPHVPAG